MHPLSRRTWSPAVEMSWLRSCWESVPSMARMRESSERDSMTCGWRRWVVGGVGTKTDDGADQGCFPGNHVSNKAPTEHAQHAAARALLLRPCGALACDNEGKEDGSREQQDEKQELQCANMAV